MIPLNFSSRGMRLCLSATFSTLLCPSVTDIYALKLRVQLGSESATLLPEPLRRKIKKGIEWIDAGLSNPDAWTELQVQFMGGNQPDIDRMLALSALKAGAVRVKLDSLPDYGCQSQSSTNVQVPGKPQCSPLTA